VYFSHPHTNKMLMECDSLKKNTFVDIGKMKLIAEYRCLVSAQIVKIYTETYENEKFVLRSAKLSCFMHLFLYVYVIIQGYYDRGVTVFFDWNFIVVTLVLFVVPIISLYIRYKMTISSKRSLDYVITGYNEWKWIFEQAKLEPAVDSKEMIQLQERFQTCHSIYKFSMTSEDRQTIDELV